MFSCCFWWFLLGALVGWLLNWLLCRLLKCCNKKSDSSETSSQSISNAASSAVNFTKNAANTVVDSASDVASTAVSATKEAASTLTESATNAVNKTINTATALKSFVLDSTAATAAGFKLKGPNDLTIVEGIGPKINELFNNAGIYTFSALSKMSEAEMQKILDDAGPKFRLAKPVTWAKQAELASENKWAELKAMQDKLTGGV